MTWTCQRVTARVRCGYVNPGRAKRCIECGKLRPAKRRPSHMAVLDLSYAEYVKINGGEQCGICGRLPGNRRLYRDHEHRGDGRARGLLCFQCNRLLGNKSAEWLEAAAAYLRRAEFADLSSLSSRDAFGKGSADPTGQHGGTPDAEGAVSGLRSPRPHSGPEAAA